MSYHSSDRSGPSASAPLPGDRDAWALAASVANDGLWYVDVTDGALRLSPRAIELLGQLADDVRPGIDTLTQRLHASDRTQVERAAMELLRGERARADFEVRLIRPGGEVRWTQLRARSMRDASGKVICIAGSIADIDMRKRAELALREESRRDVLTGLPNRLALSQHLAARLARPGHSAAARFAVLYLDLDRLKIVNDTLGHETGDALLIEIAARICSVLGPDDLAARVGGDEFVVVVNAVAGEHEVHRIAGAIHAATRPSLDVDGREVFTTLSVGVRLSDAGTVKPASMLRDADLAMYRAKRLGGGRTVSFDQDMYDEMTERLHMQAELQQALDRDELRIAYQPIFDLQEHRLSGFEALVRWEHPTRGRLSAVDFVEQARDTGLIVDIGRWMLKKVCSQLAEWRSAYPTARPFSVGLNLCDREIMEPDFAPSVEAALRNANVPASYLSLEMSEGAMTTSGEHAIPALRRLRDFGVQIRLDGFGRGSTSLSVLRRMPLSAVKIDRSFMAGIATDDESRRMVSTIGSYAQALGLMVIAEGIETSEQVTALGEIGSFRFAQGHHYGYPAGESEAKEFLM